MFHCLKCIHIYYHVKFIHYTAYLMFLLPLAPQGQHKLLLHLDEDGDLLVEMQ